MIRTENISKTYRSKAGEVNAISNLSIHVKPGKCLLLQGPSGSGKTTLLNLLGCLSRPTSGSLFIDGRDVSHLPDHFLTEIRRSKIGFIFQAFNLLHGRTVLDNIGMPLLPLGLHHEARREKALGLLRRVHLEHRAHFRVNDLSGGEQQRVAVARALINTPDIIIADEPNSNVDPHNARAILELLRELKREGRTLIISLHERSIGSDDLVDDVLMLGETS
ncbi:MAG: ABC transporter ATP-binding protein [Lentisphaerota bacterium]